MMANLNDNSVDADLGLALPGVASGTGVKVEEEDEDKPKVMGILKDMKLTYMTLIYLPEAIRLSSDSNVHAF